MSVNLYIIQKYELSNDRISRLCHQHNRLLNHIETKTNDTQVNLKASTVHISNPEWIKPQNTNPLFWHLHQEKNDIDYNMIFNKQQTECDEIFKMIEHIKSNSISIKIKSILRKHKLKINDIINELACNLTVNMNTFIALNIVFEIPLIVKRKRFCIVYNSDNNVANTFYLINYDSKELYYEKTHIPDMFMGHSIDSPLKSISSYKLDDLQSIAKQMNISITKCNEKNKTKNELYHCIETYVWD